MTDKKADQKTDNKIDGRKTSWTAERRAAAAERCRAHKPWEQSTGPKTVEGKMRASLNAIKHGARTNHFPEYDLIFKMNKRMLRLVNNIDKSEWTRHNIASELIKENRHKYHNDLLLKAFKTKFEIPHF